MTALDTLLWHSAGVLLKGLEQSLAETALQRQRQARRLTQQQGSGGNSSPAQPPSQQQKGSAPPPSPQGLTLGPGGLSGPLAPSRRLPNQAGPQGAPTPPPFGAPAMGPASRNGGPAGTYLGPVPPQQALGTEFNIDDMQKTSGEALEHASYMTGDAPSPTKRMQPLCSPFPHACGFLCAAAGHSRST